MTDRPLLAQVLRAFTAGTGGLAVATALQVLDDLEPLRLRPGRKVPNHLYAQLGDAPDDADPSIGWARDPRHVEIAVRAVNGEPFDPPARWWEAGGCLIYDRPPDGLAWHLVAEWIMAVSTPDLAERIVATVNGARTGGVVPR